MDLRLLVQGAGPGALSELMPECQWFGPGFD